MNIEGKSDSEEVEKDIEAAQAPTSTTPSEKRPREKELTVISQDDVEEVSDSASTRRARRKVQNALKRASATPKSTPRNSPKPSLSPSRPAMPPRPLLICSLGNPGAAYAHTLHSAGHTLLLALRSVLNYPSFNKDKGLANGLVSAAPIGSDYDWTLWQSTTYMNTSGPAVKKAFDAWSRSQDRREGRLVIVHDELEKPLGALSLKTAGSAKGHNGLKSVTASMGGKEYVRIGVGIGRPVSRMSEDVSSFVLKKMTVSERMKIEESAVQVLERLRGLS